MDSFIIVADDNRLGGMQNAAKKIGGSISAVVVGDESLLGKVSNRGFDHIYWIEAKADTPPENFARQIAELIAGKKPALVLANDSAPARVLLGATAAKLGAAIAGSVRSVALEDNKILASRSIADGKLLEDLKVEGSFAAIFDGEDVEAEKKPDGKVEKVNAASGGLLKTVEVAQADGESAGLLNAERVVGVGLGIRAKDDLKLVEDLARTINAQIACTLPICDDMRWFPPQKVVGSSHNQISPELYIAIGISGQPQHMSGVRDAKVIVAIDNDPDARIFKNCEYGIVGDLYKVVPELTKAFANKT